MQVILKEKVRNLGEIGDVVSVKPGYGRNFLVPQGKAERATASNIAQFEERRSEHEQRAKEVLAAAQKRAETLAEFAMTIAAKAAEEGKLYGSVGPREIEQALNAAGHEINKSEIDMPNGPIHEVGESEVHLQLHTDVEVKITVNVVSEQ